MENAPDSKPRVSWLAGRFLVLYALVALTLVACLTSRPPEKLSEAGVVMDLPTAVLGCAGRPEPVSEGERVLLPDDTEIVKMVYAAGRSPAETVNMQIVLSGADRRSIHRPEICLVGQGWKVRGGEVRSVPLKSGADLRVMVLDIVRPLEHNGHKTELNALYAYWFVSSEAMTPYHHERILRTNLDLLLHNKAHRWAYVIAMAPVLEGFVPGGKDREETWTMIQDFIREAAPTFQKTEKAAHTAVADGSTVSAYSR